MIDLFGNRSQEPAGEDKVMEQMRDLVANKEPYQDKRSNNFIYAASTALAAVVLVMGAATLSNYDKMESMEATLNNISANMEEEKEQDMLVVETITGTVDEFTKDAAEETDSNYQENLGEINEAEIEESVLQSEEINEAEILENENNSENESNSENENNLENENNIEDEETKETETTMSEGNYYIVKKGDTLVTISGAVYGSDEYVEQIKEMNQIDNVDMIYEGQKLILP